MSQTILLASSSEIRASLLRNAGVDIATEPARVDEDGVKAVLLADGARPRDIADALAEMKALKVSQKHPGALVLGCDQVLGLKDDILSKPGTPIEAREQLMRLRGTRHSLFSAAVICEEGRPVWRHVSEARLTMRDFSQDYIDGYLDRNWDSVRHSVGGYKLEEEGARLFARIDGDYFTVLGLPLIEVLSYLTLRGTLPG